MLATWAKQREQGPREPRCRDRERRNVLVIVHAIRGQGIIEAPGHVPPDDRVLDRAPSGLSASALARRCAAVARMASVTSPRTFYGTSAESLCEARLGAAVAVLVIAGG